MVVTMMLQRTAICDAMRACVFLFVQDGDRGGDALSKDDGMHIASCVGQSSHCTCTCMTASAAERDTYCLHSIASARKQEGG